MYNRLMETFLQEQDKQEGDEPILRSYYVRKLITDSSEFSEEDRQECLERGYLRASLARELVLGVLKLDGYAKLKERAIGVDISLLHFAVANIIQEVVSEEWNGDVVDMRSDHLVLLLEADPSGEDRYARIAQLLRRAQSIVNDYYHVTFTVAFSEPTADFRELTARYERALDTLAYKMIFGAGTVMTPSMVQANQDNPETNIPAELERKFIEAVKSNRQESVFQHLEQLRRAIGGMSVDAAVQSSMHLGIILKQTVREINQNKLSPLSIDLRSVDRLVFEKETLDDIFAEFRSMLDAIFADQKRGVENKDHVIVDTIKDIIQANYANPNLSLQEISDRMKMSSAYVGRIFKRQETISVADFINEIRLLNSVVLLENHNLPVNEISEKVGFSSPSYFFKLFKKRFGTTPKDYRIKKSIAIPNEFPE
jgi:AraC-like DNA-binding protein